MSIEGGPRVDRQPSGSRVTIAPSAYRMKPFDPVRGLQALAGFAGFGIGVSILYATTGFGFACPFRSLTGWDCPLCGGTRLGFELLHGHLGAAFAQNPAVFVLLVVLTVLGVAWIVEVLGGPRLRPPRPVTDRVVRIHPTRWTFLLLGLAVIYTLARNLI